MTYTEAKAKKQRCPFNVNSDGFCAASGCMGWLWVTDDRVATYRMDGEQKEIRLEAEGRCGLVGAPR